MAERTIHIEEVTADYLVRHQQAARQHEMQFRAAIDALLLEAGIKGDVTLLEVRRSGAIIVQIPEPEQPQEVRDG